MGQERMTLARVDKNIGHFVANMRADLGVTQKELAKRCHTAQSAISRLECGTISPTLVTLTKICDGLGLEFYIGMAGPQDAAPAPEHVPPLGARCN